VFLSLEKKNQLFYSNMLQKIIITLTEQATASFEHVVINTPDSLALNGIGHLSHV
jgi:hypothetical protein